jgi:F-type H+-transporting ATPase subunit alpha
VSVVAQIAVLMALTEKLFDNVPLDRIPEAELAVHEAATKLPGELQARFNTAAKLSDADHDAILQIARTALASFQPEAVPKTKTDISAQTRLTDKASS